MDIDLTKGEALRLQSAYFSKRGATALLDQLIAEISNKYEINVDDYEWTPDEGIFKSKNGDK